MHILKIIHGYPPFYNAGSEVYSQSICNELAKVHKITVFTREENPYLPDFHIRQEDQRENFQIYFVNMARAKDGFRNDLLDARFAELLEKTKPDIAHIGHLNHLSTGLIDVLNQKNVPVIFTLHDFWLMCPRGQFLQRNFDGQNLHELCEKQENRKCATTCYSMYHAGCGKNTQNTELNDVNHWTNWINTRMLETKSFIDKVDLFIAPSKYLQQRFIDDFGMPASKIVYLDYGFPLEYLQPTQKVAPNSVFTFGYIGTHIPAKGINLLIEAFAKIEGDAVLKIWGKRDAQSTTALEILAKDSHKPIEFMGGYINKNLSDEVFSKVDCIVVPSIWAENSPLVIHEAQACRIPIITANFGGMSEYVEHLTNGLTFQHRNVNDLTKQLNFALKNKNLLQKMGQRGYLHNENGEVPEIKAHCKQLETIYFNHLHQL
jgi:glycosyltransferase involved in cell wall biosynthesis